MPAIPTFSACRVCTGCSAAEPATAHRFRKVERGLAFVFVGAHLARQFEFVQSEWMKDGAFVGARGERDPIAGPNDGQCPFTIPQQPIRRRLQGLPRFVVTRGGEYFFAPSLRALRWLAELNT